MVMTLTAQLAAANAVITEDDYDVMLFVNNFSGHQIEANA